MIATRVRVVPVMKKVFSFRTDCAASGAADLSGKPLGEAGKSLRRGPTGGPKRARSNRTPHDDKQEPVFARHGVIVPKQSRCWQRDAPGARLLRRPASSQGQPLAAPAAGFVGRQSVAGIVRGHTRQGIAALRLPAPAARSPRQRRFLAMTITCPATPGRCGSRSARVRARPRCPGVS